MKWPKVMLGEVLRQNMECIEIPESREYQKLSVKLYGKGVVLDTPADGSSLKMKRHQLAKAGQVILSEILGKKGAIGFVPEAGEGALCTSHFFLFDVRSDKIESRYLNLIFQRNYLEDQLNIGARGTTGYAAVRPKHLLACEIPLPPLPEQRRIVARIEDLASRIQKAISLRKKAIEEADYICGTFQRQVFEKFATMLGTLGQGIISFRNGISRRPSGQEDGPIVLRLADVSGQEINLRNPRRGALNKSEINAYMLKPSDLLAVRVNGSRSIVGSIIVFHGAGETICYNDHLIRIRLNSEILDPEYIAAMAAGPHAREYVESVAITTAGQFTVIQGMISDLPVPIIPLLHQRSIVTELDTLKAEVARLKRLQAESAAELDALLPSILDSAFLGVI